MAQVDSETGTVFASVDWDHYVQSRPQYPPSLKELIYAHRRANTETKWERLVDVGSGVGIAAIMFASDFDNLHLVDPSPQNKAKAQVFMDQWLQRQKFGTKLQFSQCRAEDLAQHVDHGSADMVICAEAAHFIDPAALVAEAAKVLRPGGTLAIYSYWLPNFPEQSPDLSVAFNKAFTRILELCLPPGNSAVAAIFANAAAHVCAGRGILSSVPLPEHLYKDVRRVRINPGADKMMEVFKENFFVDVDPSPCRTSDSEEEVCYDSGKDPQAEGWSFATNNQWLHDLLDTFRPDGVHFNDEQHQSIYGEWDRAFAADCPSGSVVTVWPFNLVLATRK